MSNLNMFDEEKKLLDAVKFIPLVSIFLFICIALSVVIVIVLSHADTQLYDMKETYLTDKKNIAKSLVLTTKEHIEVLKKSTNNELDTILKEKVYMAHDVIASIYEQNKGKSKQEILELIKNALRDIRFFGGRGYFFIFDATDYTNILLPIDKSLEGKDFSDYKDIKGSKFVVEIAKLCKQNKEAFYEWYWKKPNSNDMGLKKVGFNKYFEPLDIFVGTGEYEEDFEKSLKEKIIRDISKTIYTKDSYIFICEYDGKCIEIIGDKTKTKGENKIVDVVNRAYFFEKALEASKNGGDFIEHDANGICKNPLKNNISYVIDIRDMKLLLGSVVYMEDIQNVIEKKKHSLVDKITVAIVIVGLIILVAIMIFYIIMIKHIDKIKTMFQAYKDEIVSKTEENQRNFEMLQQQSKLASMGEMIGNIAHQWRQPLNSLSVAVSKIALLNEEGKLEKDDLDKTLLRMENSIIHLSKTIVFFRNFFSPTDMSKTVFDIQNAIENTIDTVKDSFEHHFISLIYNSHESMMIFGNQKQLQQALINIIHNAKDSIVSKNIKDGRVEIKTFIKENQIYIKIQDNGGGIPLEVFDRIFEPYFTTKFKAQGTGIGLYMTKVIIENNFNAKLEAKNTNGGACFTIILNQDNYENKQDIQKGQI